MGKIKGAALAAFLVVAAWVYWPAQLSQAPEPECRGDYYTMVWFGRSSAISYCSDVQPDIAPEATAMLARWRGKLWDLRCPVGYYVRVHYPGGPTCIGIDPIPSGATGARILHLPDTDNTMR